MATVEEPHVFAMFDNAKKEFDGLLPVVKGPTTNGILVTTGVNTIELVNEDDRKAIQSWSTKRMQSFTSFAVYDYNTDEVIVVQQERVLRKWKLAEENIDACSKQKLPTPARCLLPVPNYEPLIVFRDGNVSILSRCFDEYPLDNEGFLASHDTIIWASALREDDVFKVAILLHNKKTKDHVLRFKSLSALTSEVVSVSDKVLSSSRTKELVACALHADGMAVLTLWSDGEVRSCTGNTETTLLLLDSGTKWLGIETVNKTHFVVAGILSNSDNVLEIWDFKFCVKKTMRIVPCAFSKEWCRMKMLDSMLYVECENKILQVPLIIEQSSLEFALGKLPISSCNEPTTKSRNYSWSMEGLQTVPRKQSTGVFDNEQLGGDVPLLCRDLFSKLCKSGDVVGILDALHSLTDIPELEITKLVRYILGLNEDAFDELNTSFEGKECTSLSSKKAFCLNAVLSIPYNDVFIHNSLKNLSVQETLSVLRHLNTFVTENNADMQQNHEKLTILKAIGWINLLLDSHFSELLLTTDSSVQRTLSDIFDNTTNSLHLCKDMEDIDQLIRIILNRIHLKKQIRNDFYHIEVLHI